MKRFPKQAVIVLALLASLWAGDKKKAPQLYTKPGQSIDLEPTKLVTARQNCENWAIAAGLESMLKREGVALDQNFWVLRINGGELCVPELPSTDTLAGVVNKEFVLDDGHHVLLEFHYVPGAPDNPDALLAGLKQQRLTLLLWRGHPYYLTGATYDEHVNRNGLRMFIITELRLADTFSGQPTATFVNGRDKMDEIGGVISVSAMPLDVRQHW